MTRFRSLDVPLYTPLKRGLEFGHFSPDANGISSYQPGATPQEKRANKVVLSANGAIHKTSNLQLATECGYETGRWPAIHIPGALPRAGMIDAFGVEIRGPARMSKLQTPLKPGVNEMKHFPMCSGIKPGVAEAGPCRSRRKEAHLDSRMARLRFNQSLLTSAPTGVECFPSHAGSSRSRGFTLLELLVVITIIGLLAALAMPVMRNFKANYTASVSSQLLTDLGRARQLAISERTTVYMVFVPTNFWPSPAFNTYQKWFYASAGRSSNLFEKQLVAYNFVTLHSLGDQPGRNTVRYLSSWKTLPEGAFIHPAKFQNININSPNPPRPVMTITNGTLPFQIFGMNYSDKLTPIPFPSEDAPRYNLNIPYVSVPYIAFDYMGRLTSGRDEILPLTKGSVLFARDANGLGKEALPAFNEQPPGNTTNSYNLVYIDWLTGRARALQQEVR